MTDNKKSNFQQMRKFLYLIPFILGAAFLIISLPGNNTIIKKKFSKHQRIQGAIEDRLFTSSDVDLGHIPYNKLFAAIEEGYKRASQKIQGRSFNTNLTDAVWRSRGPNNVAEGPEQYWWINLIPRTKEFGLVEFPVAYGEQRILRNPIHNGKRLVLFLLPLP